MSDYTSTAQVELTVNGRPAEVQLDKLKSRAEDLRDAIAKAAREGDKASVKKWDAELKRVRREIKNIQDATKNVADVMRRLDQASPKELKQTLKALERQLQGMTRGTREWTEQCRKIKLVRTELASVNSQLAAQEPIWRRLATKVNIYSNMLMSALGAITGLIFTGRKAVDAYAEIEQEMANVRKFTGMTAEQVEDLNEEFKRMDTRSSREQLNQLAQEAGRLGKTSKEDVLGFVRAADQINVALDELGDGATLELSKLTQIFGDEQRLGTEKALLSVGSVINELSQNCAASAPYLTEFARRMGGVGAQAGMTVQQIMGIAAVLDSKGQKVEASATAIAQVLTRMYQDPSKYAKAAGLDVQQFADLVRRDANEALMVLSETLHAKGGLKDTAPIFKDMGENGARAVAALSTLAENIKEVRAQQEVANEAFAEGTSVTKEFDVQNNTVQAGLDKAKKHFKELAVELGQKLVPVMRHAITGTSAMVRGLSIVVNFVIEYRTQILELAAGIAVYSAAMNVAIIKTKTMAAWAAICKGANYAWMVVQQAWYVVLALCSKNTHRLTTEIKLLSAMLKTNPWGLAIAAITAVIVALTTYIAKTRDTMAAQKQLIKIKQEATQKVEEERVRINLLIKAAKDETLTLAERQRAVAKLNAIIPNYNAQLDATTGKYRANKRALDDYLRSLARKYQLEGAKDTLRDLGRQRAQAVADREKANNDLSLLQDQRRNAGPAITGGSFGNDYSADAQQNNTYDHLESMYRNRIQDANNRVLQLEHQLEVITNAFGSDLTRDIANEPSESATTTNAGGGGGGGNGRNANSRAERAARQALKDGMKEKEAERDTAIRNLLEQYNANEVSETDYLAQELDIWTDYYVKAMEFLEEKGHKDTDTYAELGREMEDRIRKAEDRLQRVELKDLKATHTISSAENKAQLTSGLIDYEQYLDKQEQLDQTYIDGRKAIYKKFHMEESQEYAAVLADEENLRARQLERESRRQRREIDQRHETAVNKIDTDFYTPGAEIFMDKAAYDERIFSELVKYLEEKRDTYVKMSDEWVRLNDQIEQATAQRARSQQSKYAETYKLIMSDEVNKNEYDQQLALLTSVYQAELAMAGDNEERKLALTRGYNLAKLALAKQFGQIEGSEFQKAILKSAKWLESDGGKAVTQSFSTIASGMGDIFSGLSTMIQAELDMQTAAIEKRYDKEISRAEGNSYLVSKIEKQKEAEIAKAKDEANKKMFKMQIIQAVAQTAQNAINAYGSAAAIPIVGTVMAPIAAAMAIAAGAIQIAAIKKQQQASAAQGYSEGGFTPDGDKNKPVGIVHAGEWIASQKLTKNKAIRPLLKALDDAQKSNVLGSLTPSAAAALMPATVGAGLQATDVHPQVVVNVPQQHSEQQSLTKALDRLNSQLDKPIGAVVTVTGDHGIARAQDEYDRLIKNKSPKYPK